MKNLLWIFTILMLFALVTAIFKAKLRSKTPRGKLWRKKILTDREQAMCNRLIQTFPDYIVLSQVSFSALITSKDQRTRNGFNRKVADFVLCDRAFEVLAIVELDDKSHKGREVIDNLRDNWLTSVGYRVVRYSNVPDIEKLRADFATNSVAGAN